MEESWVQITVCRLLLTEITIHPTNYIDRLVHFAIDSRHKVDRIPRIRRTSMKI